MDSKEKSKIELTTSAEDWEIIRECYVKSFLRYPLYKYMVPDQSKREEFLRAYLNANYDVTVGSGEGILLAIKVLVESENNNENESKYKVVGGVVFVPPSSDGNGWAIGSDEPYWKAYEKHQLAKISKDGLERVKRYEAWENERITQKASGTRIPLWNGLFCAIEPEYASKGVGSAVYKEAIRIMARSWVRRQTSPKRKDAQKLKCQEKKEEKGLLSRVFRNTSFSNLHRFALLHHRALPSAAFVQKNAMQQSNTKISQTPQALAESNSSTKTPVSIKNMMFNPNAPLVIAISHSDRASSFHQSNGFQPISRLPFHDEKEDVTPFYTHVLALDPFCTGKLSHMKTALRGKNGLWECDISTTSEKDLTSAQSSSILL